MGMVAFVGALKYVTFGALFCIYVCALVVCGIKVTMWRCPSCGKPFCRKSQFERSPIYTQECVHCGTKRPKLGFYD
jgi:hypothetical protein